jgi:hypothetical protein
MPRGSSKFNVQRDKRAKKPLVPIVPNVSVVPIANAS